VTSDLEIQNLREGLLSLEQRRQREVAYLATRLMECEETLREAGVLLDHYDRTSSLDRANNIRMGARRRKLRNAIHKASGG
jgi:hypothetical protein